MNQTSTDPDALTKGLAATMDAFSQTLLLNKPHAVMPQHFSIPTPCLVALCAMAAMTTQSYAIDLSCQLKYPIVLSHHWAMSPICADTEKSGPASCVNTQDYDKYCTAKTTSADGQKACGHWQVTAEEAALPPRNVNATDPSLTRETSQFHRYFSLAIVKRLRDVCGNAVYIADKPVYGSYDVRARSLRETVQQALAGEHASKVIVIGFSQGVQDARYMAALLPKNDAHPEQGLMKDKVAALVSLAGEDGGAEASEITLDVVSSLTSGDWRQASQTLGVASTDLSHFFWQRSTAAGTNAVLVENCRGQGECTLNADDQNRWLLRSVYDLSTRYMRPSWQQRVWGQTNRWTSLRDYVNADATSWSERISPAAEANNGIAYLSYAAQVQKWHEGWGAPLGRESLFHSLISISDGPNDVYVSVGRQMFLNQAANVTHVKTLAGNSAGRGYHHMFFSGRNDALYVPEATQREQAPYGGNAADFYQQVAIDLKNRGF